MPPFLLPQPQDYSSQQHALWAGGITMSSHEPLARARADTGSELAREWANPSVVVATVLMFVGGDVVQEALAQTTGRLLAPVCFSFGWVSYALAVLKDVFGEGRLLPRPDYPVKVFNVASGYYRANNNWVIGRMVRDHESWISRFEPLGNSGIRIAIFEAVSLLPGNDEDGGGGLGVWSALAAWKWDLLGVLVMLVQLAVAAVPTVRTAGHEWGILAITGLGTALALMMGALPQWWIEKMPCSRESAKVFALTAGNGSREVMVIKGMGRCLDLEQLATQASPRTARPWTQLERGLFSLPGRRDSWGRDARTIFGLPVGLILTRTVCVFNAIGWVLILISLAGIRSHTWCLLAVGALGLAYNSVLASLARDPASRARGMPLRLLDTISTSKTMDGLMDLEETHAGCGRALLREFFPGELGRDEDVWWKTSKGQRQKTEYDVRRAKDWARRLRPRSMLPQYSLHGVSDSTGLARAAAALAKTPSRTSSPLVMTSAAEDVTPPSPAVASCGPATIVVETEPSQGAADAGSRPSVLTREPSRDIAAKRILQRQFWE